MDLHGSASTVNRRSSQVSPRVRISRASQLDAAQIDETNFSMLKGQLKKVFSMMPHIFSKYEPELMACVKFFVWRFSIWLDKPTPGNAARGLRYRNDGAFQLLMDSGKVKTGLEGPGLTTLQKIGFLLTMVGVPYGCARLQMLEYSGGTQLNMWSAIMQIGEKAYKVTNLANFLLFLNTGRFRTLVERVLNARLVYQRPNTIQIATSELLNRQLVWGEFSELLLILLPLLKRVPAWFRWGSSKTIDAGGCAVCAANPITIPYASKPCGHLYCYYCLSTRCTSNRAFRCASCNKEVTGMQRFKGDEPAVNSITVQTPQG